MDLIRDYFLEAFPNPERTGCPDEETLMSLAEHRLPSGHPALTHVVSCSECFAEYRGCCSELEDRKKSKVGPAVEKLKSTNWSVIASRMNVEKREAGTKAVQCVREWVASVWEWIANYQHRYSR